MNKIENNLKTAGISRQPKDTGSGSRHRKPAMPNGKDKDFRHIQCVFFNYFY